MAKLFANSGDPVQTPCPTLFGGLQSKWVKESIEIVVSECKQLRSLSEADAQVTLPADTQRRCNVDSTSQRRMPAVSGSS